MPDQTPRPTVLAVPQVHWISLAVAVLPALLTATVVAIAPAIPILWVLFVPCLPILVNALIMYCFTDIKLNQHRLVYARGLFRRQTLDLPLDRIELVQMEQSLLGRLMDYGQITIIAIGSTPIITPCIKQPAKFREALQLAASKVTR